LKPNPIPSIGISNNIVNQIVTDIFPVTLKQIYQLLWKIMQTGKIFLLLMVFYRLVFGIF